MRSKMKRFDRYAAAFQAMILLGAGLLGIARTARAQEAEEVVPGAPTFRDVLSLRSVGPPVISPDGSTIAYTVSAADWEENRWDTEIWLAREGAEPFQLTRTAEGSSSLSFTRTWSPDGRWLAFAADRGDGRQIYLIRPDGGEAQRLTAVEQGVGSFAWSPDGTQIAVSITEQASEEDEHRKEEYGAWEVEDAEHRMTHLWVLDVERALDTDGGATLPAEDDEDESETDHEAGDTGGDEGDDDAGAD